MGFIVDDHDLGIGGEARRESFILLFPPDSAEPDSVELRWELLSELEYVLEELKNARSKSLRGVATPGVKEK